MCTDKRWIKNKYNGESYFVKCGKCESCQQEKANHVARRIMNQFSTDYDCFFCTMTYKNKFIPYIRRSELDSYDVNVYRDYDVKRVRLTRDYRYINKIVPSGIINNVNIDNLDDSFLRIPSLRKYDSDKLGVCFFKDGQDFLKRFRQNLIRHYAFQDKFYYFLCSEYGTNTLRPHFHLLLFFPRGFADVAKAAFFESWSYDDLYRKEKSFEYARKPSSYVSSYLSKYLDFPAYLRNREIRQKHSYSQNFGIAKRYLSYDSLLECIRRKNLIIDCKSVAENAVSGISSFLFPKYIINRLFPRFKGDFRIDNSQMADVFSASSKGKYILKNICEMSDDDIKHFYVRLTNCRDRFAFYSKLNNLDDYFWYYQNVWKCYNQSILKLWYNNMVTVRDMVESYDNVAMCFYHRVESNIFPFLNEENLDPNNFLSNYIRTNDLKRKFYNRQHQKVFADEEMNFSIE